MPTVSVIIPFYSNVSWLIEAVESVMNQEYKDYEIIVVNDGSIEDVSKFLEGYGDCIRYVWQSNKGAAIARNTGIGMARGKYVAFLDSDDIWLPQKLSIQVKKMEEYSAIWSCCSYQTFGKGKSVERRMSQKKEDTVAQYHNPYIATPCVMVKRQYLVEHPECRFHPELKYGQDSYFWLMINSENHILVLPEILVKVRIRGTNAGKQARVQLKARGELWTIRKTNKEKLISPFDISCTFKIASELCVISDAILLWLEKRIASKTKIEFISKILFVIPWAMFKVERWFRRLKIKWLHIKNNL